MKYLSADLLPKVFHGLVCVTYMEHILITVFVNQNSLYFFRHKVLPVNYLTLYKTTISLCYNVMRPMKYLLADLLPKVFHGLVCVTYLSYTYNNYF